MKKSRSRFRKTGGEIGLPAFERLIRIVEKKREFSFLGNCP